MNKSKIEWTDYTWNPITGCLHDCPYCYARKISKSFSGDVKLNLTDERAVNVGNNLYELNEKWGGQINFPCGFFPTLHKYRLDWPQKVKKGLRVFVCSMADMFGNWVPDAWIEQIFIACEKAPQHTYMFLTKNPKRYKELAKKGILRRADNFWYGSTMTRPEAPFFDSEEYNTFVSIEPLLEEFDKLPNCVDWIIIGAETGNRKDKLVPKDEWICNILNCAEQCEIPVFMKNSLIDIVGEENMKYEVPNALKNTAHICGGKPLYYAKCGMCKKEFKKSDMHTILNKRKRSESAKVIGYVCEDCYDEFKRNLSEDLIL